MIGSDDESALGKRINNKTANSTENNEQTILSQISPEVESALLSTPAALDKANKSIADRVQLQEQQLAITEDILELPSTSEAYKAINKKDMQEGRHQFNQQEVTDLNTVSAQQDVTQIAVNNTVISEGKGSVIIIKENKLQINGNMENSLFRSPKEFSTNINKTAFNRLTIKDIRVNRQASIAAVEVDMGSSGSSKEDFEAALKVTKIGDYSVTCYAPNRDKYKCGVISPIRTDEDLLLLLEDMQINNRVRIVKLDRLGKRGTNNNIINSLAVKVTFEEINLPTTVKCGYFSFKVRPYVYNPTQCFKCQRLWHTAASCKGRERCLKCAGEHSISNCSSTITKCANCLGSHRANSKECGRIREAYEIEKLRASGYSFLEAQKEVMHLTTEDDPSSNQDHAPQTSRQNMNIVDNKTTYSQAVKNRFNQSTTLSYSHEANAKSVKVYKEMSTQTEESIYAEGTDNPTSSSSNSVTVDEKNIDFLLKLIEVISVVLEKKVQNESDEIRKNVIYACFKHKFTSLPIINQAISTQSREAQDNTMLTQQIQKKMKFSARIL